MTGKVEHIVNNGTIVSVFTDAGVVHFDHRMFANFYEAEGPLVGRTITVSYEDDGTEIVEVD